MSDTKPVCGPSIEPESPQWVDECADEIRSVYEQESLSWRKSKELIASLILKHAPKSEELIDELSRLRSEAKSLEAHRDALKKAKVLLNDGQPPWSNPVFLAHTLENASWRYGRESLIATINALNL